jgi:hypothetical protein
MTNDKCFLPLFLKGSLDELSEIMWEVFVAGYLGYTGVRSWEKSRLVNN